MKTTLDELQAFAAVVDTGSITAASELLGLTISATSRTLGRLEEKLQTTLLRRTTRRLELTQAGDTLYAYGRNILDLEREARAKLRGTPLRGRLRIGALEDFAGAWLPQVLQRFAQWHPEATVELKVGITADLLRQQERGRLDLVFGKQCSRVEGSGTLLWEEPLVWAFAADHPLPAQAPLPLAVFPEHASTGSRRSRRWARRIAPGASSSRAAAWQAACRRRGQVSPPRSSPTASAAKACACWAVRMACPNCRRRASTLSPARTARPARR